MIRKFQIVEGSAFSFLFLVAFFKCVREEEREWGLYTSIITIPYHPETSSGARKMDVNKTLAAALAILLTVSHGLEQAAAGVSIPGCGETEP